MKKANKNKILFVTLLMTTACSNPSFNSSAMSTGDGVPGTDSSKASETDSANSTGNSANPGDLPGSASGGTGNSSSGNSSSGNSANDPNSTVNNSSISNTSGSSSGSGSSGVSATPPFVVTDGKKVDFPDGNTCRISAGKEITADQTMSYQIDCETAHRSGIVRGAHWDASFYLKVGEMLPPVSKIVSIKLDSVWGDDQVEFSAGGVGYKCMFDGRQAICPMGYQGHPAPIELVTVAKQNADGFATVLKIDDIMGDSMWGHYTLKVVYSTK